MAQAGAFEDTMFLIELMRQQKEKEVRAKKVGIPKNLNFLDI
jgi:hypothetical protein